MGIPSRAFGMGWGGGSQYFRPIEYMCQIFNGNLKGKFGTIHHGISDIHVALVSQYNVTLSAKTSLMHLYHKACFRREGHNIMFSFASFHLFLFYDHPDLQEASFLIFYYTCPTRQSVVHADPTYAYDV